MTAVCRNCQITAGILKELLFFPPQETYKLQLREKMGRVNLYVRTW